MVLFGLGRIAQRRDCYTSKWLIPSDFLVLTSAARNDMGAANHFRLGPVDIAYRRMKKSYHRRCRSRRRRGSTESDDPLMDSDETYDTGEADFADGRAFDDGSDGGLESA